MITIYSTEAGARLKYVADILFNTLLGIDYRITQIHPDQHVEYDSEPGEFIMFHGRLVAGRFCIPAAGLLSEKGFRKQDVRVVPGEILKIFFGSTNFPEDYSLDFDLFSASFYLLSGYEQYGQETFDEHGRYLESGILSHDDAYFKKPVVDIYARLLLQEILKRFPSLKYHLPVFNYKITFDIDAPYLYLHHTFPFSAGSAIKKVLTLNFKKLINQVRAIITRKDPYDVYDYILSRCAPDYLLFFFLIARNHPHDGRFTIQSKAYRELIRKLSDSRVATGIHPSYNSFLDSRMIIKEKANLEKVTGEKITHSRMHFLKYRMPETFEYLLSAGITDDYSLCMIHGSGFRNFVSKAVPWYNVITDEITNLTLHPTMIMDRSLQKYLSLNASESIQAINHMIDTCVQYGGEFTILFHNSSLDESKEWEGWRKVFESVTDYLENQVKQG